MKQNVKIQKGKFRPEFKLAESLENNEQSDDLRTLDSNIIIAKLEDNIRLRDMSVKKRFEELIRK